MIVGVKYLTWAPFTSGGDGQAITYGTGTAETDKVVHVDMSEERADDAFYADDHKIDRDNSVTGASLAIEVAKLTQAMKTGMLGHVAGATTGDYSVTDAAAPFVGVGFVVKDRYKGANAFRAYWYHKVQFSEGSRAFDTRQENINFQTESLEGDAEAVQLTSGGAYTYYEYTEVATEAGAYAWLKGRAGISG